MAFHGMLPCRISVGLYIVQYISEFQMATSTSNTEASITKAKGTLARSSKSCAHLSAIIVF